MGYNGGVNKRGYYRRFNGGASKSSFNAGSKIFDKCLFGWTSLVKSTDNSSRQSFLLNEECIWRHYNPKLQILECIVLSIFAFGCSIGGILMFLLEEWPIFLTIAVFGFLEWFFLIGMGWLDEDVLAFYKNNGAISYYIYDDEIETSLNHCNKIVNLQKAIYVVSFLLNMYPIVFLIIDLTICSIYDWNFGGELIAFGGIVINLMIKGSRPILAKPKYYDIENFSKVFSIRKRASIGLEP